MVISAVVLSLYVVRRFCKSGRMQVYLYLLIVLHVAEGECIIISLTADTSITQYYVKGNLKSGQNLNDDTGV